MTIKINAPRTISYGPGGLIIYERCVRESDWRRIMAVVKAADEWADFEDASSSKLSIAVGRLRKHTKRKP